MGESKSKAGHNDHCRGAKRQLVLLDIENFTRTSSPTVLDLAIAERKLGEVFCDFGQTLWVMACSHWAARTVAFAFPQARHLWRSGPDGADYALIDEMTDLRTMTQFDGVILVSGDWRFAESLAALARQGIETTVVSWVSSLSRRLRLAAQHVIALADGDTTFGEAS